jgi:hypothetical protein
MCNVLINLTYSIIDNEVKLSTGVRILDFVELISSVFFLLIRIHLSLFRK